MAETEVFEDCDTGIMANDYASVNSKLDCMMTKMDERFDKVEEKIGKYEESLEFTQAEVDDLKKQNNKLKRYIDSLHTIVEKNVYQLEKLESKFDKLETASKKHQLVVEGVPELSRGEERIEGVVRDLFDALKLPREVEVDICHRVGQFNKHRTRPILISFYGMADRNLVYENRANLAKTKAFARTWINEDLGQVAKRTRNVVRQVAKQAQRTGREFSATKYAVYIDNKKYDETNFKELPDEVSMETMKMQVYGNTLYY